MTKPGAEWLTMKPRRLPAAPARRPLRIPALPGIVAPSLWAIVLAMGLSAVQDAGAQRLEFLQPTNGAVFSTLDEIPIALRASAPNDVILSAEVRANVSQLVTTALYCCPLCFCPQPQPGQVTLLRMPAYNEDGTPSARMWQSWTNVAAGTYQLSARAVSDGGLTVDAAPIRITVLDLTLRIHPGADGAMVLSIAQGAMVSGGYDLEASADLQTWTRLGSFSPGNVAAFYWDRPPADAATRFYRAVYVPPVRP